MKPEKVDFYLNKRKEREKEKKSEGEGGSSAAQDVEQFPNRSPASEENIRTRISPTPGPETDPLEIKQEDPLRYSPDYCVPTTSSGHSTDWPAPYPDWSGLWRPRPVILSAQPRPLHQGLQTSVITSHGALKRETESSSSEDEAGRYFISNIRTSRDLINSFQKC